MMIRKAIGITALLFSVTACQSTPETTAADTPLTLTGTWKVESIMDQPPVDYSPAKFIFSADGKFSGNNSCNTFFGTYSHDGENLTLSPVGNTMKACINSLNEQEQLVKQAIPQVKTVAAENDTLLLKGDNDELMFKLTPLAETDK